MPPISASLLCIKVSTTNKELKFLMQKLEFVTQRHHEKVSVSIIDSARSSVPAKHTKLFVDASAA